MNLLNAIPYGRENAVSRSDIVRKTGIPDRRIREEIKSLNRELAKHGEAILSSSGKSGYWRSADIKEMKEYLRESDHRRNQIFLNDEPIRKLVYAKEGVKRVPVRAHFRSISHKDDDGQVLFDA